MSVISLDRALSHLRVDEDIDSDIASKLDAAEQIAKEYLNRNFYATLTELNDAKGQVASILSTARTQYDQDVLFAKSLDGELIKTFSHTASLNYDTAIRSAKMISLGIVINPSIEISVLLILGDLYENREDTISGGGFSNLPKGAEWHLDPFRIDLGVG
ncbi:head-tail connector protein [Acinetobacter proteolyticus]|nr:head-tail connector protein [Acinetobacter proteolyticus]WEI17143.1 head-tail connector protein [Acinetobacter proteolyticus]